MLQRYVYCVISGNNYFVIEFAVVGDDFRMSQKKIKHVSIPSPPVNSLITVQCAHVFTALHERISLVRRPSHIANATHTDNRIHY